VVLLAKFEEKSTKFAEDEKAKFEARDTENSFKGLED